MMTINPSRYTVEVFSLECESRDFIRIGISPFKSFSSDKVRSKISSRLFYPMLAQGESLGAGRGPGARGEGSGLTGDFICFSFCHWRLI